MRLIEPPTTCKSCGSSSSRVRLRNAPVRVTRSSSRPDSVGPVRASASVCIVRTFHKRNSRPPRPTRRWRIQGAPGLPRTTAKVTKRRIGATATSRTPPTTRSRARRHANARKLAPRVATGVRGRAARLLVPARDDSRPVLGPVGRENHVLGTLQVFERGALAPARERVARDLARAQGFGRAPGILSGAEHEYLARADRREDLGERAPEPDRKRQKRHVDEENRPRHGAAREKIRCEEQAARDERGHEQAAPPFTDASGS